MLILIENEFIYQKESQKNDMKFKYLILYIPYISFQ